MLNRMGCALVVGAAVVGSQFSDVARSDEREGPIRVVCTIGMIGDLVRNIGGEHVDVVTLMGEGIDPHLYKASPGDVRLLRGADMIFYNGLSLEGRMADVLTCVSGVMQTKSAPP